VKVSVGGRFCTELFDLRPESRPVRVDILPDPFKTFSDPCCIQVRISGVQIFTDAFKLGIRRALSCMNTLLSS
jgi:hypothetical protein